MYGAGEDDSRPLQDGAGQFAFSEKSIRMGKWKRNIMGLDRQKKNKQKKTATIATFPEVML